MEWIDEKFLASSHVGTPDPRQKDPPHGQRLIVAWDLPRSALAKKPRLIARVRLWNSTEERVERAIDRQRGVDAFYFDDTAETEDRRIIAYRVEVRGEGGELIEEWVHHFWTELIAVDREERALEAASRSSSVSPHPMQGSVRETP